MSRQFALLAFALLVLASSCQKEDDRPVSVSGTVRGAEGKKLYLEYLGIQGITLEDSLTLDAAGKFDFKASAPEYPDYFRLRIGSEFIPFSADSLEQIKVTADAFVPGSFGTNYTMEGNGTGKAIQAIWVIYQDAATDIAGLMKQYSNGKLSIFDYQNLRDKKLEPYKRVVSEIIYSDPASQDAYFGLMQQLDGSYIFNPSSPEDSRLFATVANVMVARDSLSPRTKHLYDLALRSMATVRAMRKRASQAADTTAVKNTIPTEVVGYIDIQLPDANGTKRSLKSVAAGGVTLISFTSMSADWAPDYNGIVSKLFDKYRASGLRIYQVNMDTDQHAWRNVIKNQPWVNVIETRGGSSEYIGLYGLTSLPALFLIDKGGNIVLRASHIDELEKRISTELAR